MTPPASTRRLPGCGSAWKKPSSKICFEQDPRPGHRDVRRVDAQAADAVQVVDRDAVDELHRDHPRRRKLLEDHRDVRGRVAGELVAAALHGPALDREVELALQRPLELAGQLDGPIRGQHREPPLERAGPGS